MDKQSWINRFKSWIRPERLPDGPLPNGHLSEVLGAQSTLFVIDDKGRLFELVGAPAHNADFLQVINARSSLIALMDRWNVQDLVTMPEMGDGTHI